MEEAPGMGGVRVATLNLFGRQGAWDERRLVLLDGLSELRPDDVPDLVEGVGQAHPVKVPHLGAREPLLNHGHYGLAVEVLEGDLDIHLEDRSVRIGPRRSCSSLRRPQRQRDEKDLHGYPQPKRGRRPPAHRHAPPRRADVGG